jgi:uncharacterized membrane protein
MLSRESLAGLHSPGRLATMVSAGVAAALVTGFAGEWRYAWLVGGDVSALTFIVVVWVALGPMDAATTAQHVNREDPGRKVSDVIVLIAALASLAAVGFVLAQSHGVSHTRENVAAALGLGSVALSWGTLHTLFMLRYGRLYYTGVPGGIDFKQDADPRYVDFAYVAFTVGMTFQISDTDISSSQIRATVLRHALLAYLFGAVILAAAINLVIGIAAGG